MNTWNDSPGQRPTKEDFDPWSGFLDAICAWRNFGGLSLTNAYAKFCESPLNYQEDFMFMGGEAFAYYFPVIERYILESRAGTEEFQDVEAIRILAAGIEIQFDVDTVHHVEHLRQRILELTRHVRGNLAQYCVGADEQKRVDAEWQRLERKLQAGDASK